jgi:hypothetical protein
MAATYAQFNSASGGGSSSNASVGPTGTTAPTSATEVGYVNGSGNLTAVSPSTPLPVTINSGGSPVNANSQLSPTQSVTTSESSLAAPTNAVGVIVESDSSNTGNVRWGFSNSAAAILSSTKGMLMEPGRDSGFLPLGFGNYLHLIALTSTSSVNVQWVLSS